MIPLSTEITAAAQHIAYVVSTSANTCDVYMDNGQLVKSTRAAGDVIADIIGA